MDLTRSEFLRGLSLAAATGALSREGLAGLSAEESALEAGQEGVTLDDLKAAQKVARVEFTEEELQAILRSVQSSVGSLDGLRAATDDWLLAPACVYRVPSEVPLVPGTVSTGLRGEVVRPADDEDLAWLSVAELGQLLRNRKVTSLELTRLALARLKRFGPKLRCVAALTEERALAAAARADEEISAGRIRGPLHGIPYGVKDLFATKGAPTQWGAAPFKGQSFEFDAAVVEMLETAGAVLVAKLSLGALAMNDVWYEGRTESPWNPRIGSSGSSAGSASAVAAGLVPFAIGTETSGSIVSPAHNCRVVGLRPTFGSISRYGGMTLSWTLDKVGPICRSATDCALVFDALRGADPRDRSSVTRPFGYGGAEKLAGKTLGYLVLREEDVSKPVAVEGKAHLEKLAELGVTFSPVYLPQGPGALSMIINAECGSSFDAYTRGDAIDGHKENGWPAIFRSARFVSAVDYLNADRARGALAKTYSELLDPFEAVVADDRVYGRVYQLNCTGHPQVLVPLPMGENQAPRSFSLIGKAWSEGALLGIAQTVLEAFGRDKERPDMSQWEG